MGMENTEEGNNQYILLVIYGFANAEYIQLFKYHYWHDEVSLKCCHGKMKCSFSKMLASK